MPMIAGMSAKGRVRSPAIITPPLALFLSFEPKSAAVTLEEARNEIAVPSALASVFIGFAPIMLK